MQRHPLPHAATPHSTRPRPAPHAPPPAHAPLSRRALATLLLAPLCLVPPSLADDAPAAAGVTRELSSEERLLLEQNQRIAALNRAPEDFPIFVRKGYEVKVLADGYTYSPDGLVFKEFAAGSGPQPEEGQQVVFHYPAYNESGRTIDSSYRQGRPAETRLGIGGMIPGFEATLRGMRVGGKRRVVVPPDLGPPVGPATFFSAKQFEVFDVELLAVKSCVRTQSGMFSTVQCQ